MGVRHGATPGFHAARTAPRASNLGCPWAGSRGESAHFLARGIGKLKIARAVASDRCGRGDGCYRLASSTGKANARAVSSPGACVTIARQPPCPAFAAVPLQAALKAFPEPRPFACVSVSGTLGVGSAFVTGNVASPNGLRRPCGDCATGSLGCQRRTASLDQPDHFTNGLPPPS